MLAFAPMAFIERPATLADLPSLRIVMDRAIGLLQAGFLSAEQIAASRAFMGIDTQLIVDGTYFIVEENGRAAGCGGVEPPRDSLWRRS